MSFPTGNLVVGLEFEGAVKYLSDIDVEAGTYTANDDEADAEVFEVKEGAKVLRALRDGEPDKTFLAISHE